MNGRPPFPRPTCLLLVHLLLASCTTPTPTSPLATPDPFRELFETGDALAAAGARTAAQATLQEAAALHPYDPTPHLRLAHLYLDWNRPEEGLAALSAGQLGGPTAESEALRAGLHAAGGDWEEAIAHGAAALALDPADFATRHLVARGYVILGRAEAAQVQYRALLEADPADPLAQERLGVLLALADPIAALPHLQAASTPLASDVHDVLRQPEDVPAHRLALLGQVCLEHGEPALARQALERAVAHNPLYADAHALLGQALDDLGHHQEALALLERAVLLAPDAALTRSLLGLHHLRRGDPNAARPHLEAAYDLDPESPALSLYLAHTYAGLGQYVVADIWLEEAIRLAPEDPVVWEAVARFHLARMRSDEPRGTEAARILAGLTGSAEAEDLLGWAYFLAGNEQEAEEHLSRAVERDPALAIAHYHLGQLYTHAGRLEEAQAALTRAIDLNTDPALRAEIERALVRLNE